MKIKHLLIFLLLAALCPWTAMAQKTHIANTSSSTQMTWAEFAQNVNNGYTYEGQTVYLDSDVTATTMAGTNETNCFKGTFEGQGHTLTFNYTASGSYYTAPFHYLNGATIQNLKVSGTITANYARCGGLAGNCYGTNAIINCLSNITINSTVNGDGTHGGFISRVYRGSTTFEGCTFAGSLLGGNTTANGGFVGWSEGNNNYASVSFSNCIYAPVANTTDPSAGATFARGRNNSTTGITISNCFYTSSEFQYIQGKQRYTITAESPVTVAMSGTATNYNLSHITAYSGNQGLVYNGTIVAGDGNQVRLNLSGAFSYNADHGTITGSANPYTLSMEAYNTTISAIIQPASFSYSTGFEDACDWELVNGSCTNKWCQGTAAHNGEGTHGLYISNDGGTNNTYTTSSSSMVYAYKTFHFEAGIYDISYDWKANGEDNYDFLRVALVPESINLGASTSMPSGFSTTTLPEGWIALDGGSKLNLSTEWQNKHAYFTIIETTGDYKMVFAWRNDNTVGTDPPAAIDNVNIDAIHCATPRNLTASNLTATTADLSWLGGLDVESYTIEYRTYQYFKPIYSEGFEYGIEDWTLRDCTGETGLTNENPNSGNFAFLFDNSTSPQYFISPELTGIDELMELRFFGRHCGHNGAESVYVGFSYTDTENGSFTFSEVDIGLFGRWDRYDVTVPAGTKYICFRRANENDCQIAIDDISIGLNIPEGEWQSVNVTGGPIHMSTTLTGLIPETPYQAYAFSDCTTGSTSTFSYFTTLPTCVTPTDLTVSDVRGTSANLSWTGNPEVESYTVKYRTLSTATFFSEGFEDGTMPSGWTQSGPGTWNVTEGYGYNGIGTHSGTYNVRINHNGTGNETFLITPMLDLSGQSNLALNFWYVNYNWGSSDIDQLYVYYRVDQGEWIELWSTTEDHQEWTESGAIMLPNLSANYQIGFKMIDKWGRGVGIDDITISSTIPTSAWQTATVEGNATEVNTTLTGLMPETTYEAYTYPDCDLYKKSEIVSFTTGITCPIPHDFTADSLTATTAYLSWEAWPEVEDYTVQYRIYEHTRFIFSEGFEYGIDDWTLRDCTGNTGLTSEDAHTGDVAFFFDNNGTTQYLISPELPNIDEEMLLRFYGRHRSHNDDEIVYVGFSATNTDNASFDFVELYVGSFGENWSRLDILVPAGTKYICFKRPNDNVCPFFIDDIRIEKNIPEGEPQTVNVAGGTFQGHVTLTGLIPETKYQAKVYNDCSNGSSRFLYFTTLESCVTPADLTVATGATTASLSWTGEPDMDGYTVKYRTSSTISSPIFTEGFENGIGNWTLRDCHNFTGIFPSSDGVHSGDASFRFYYSTTPPQYLISPELTGVAEGMKLKFYYKNGNTDYPETFQVGFSTTNNATASFTFGNEITASDTEWHFYVGTIPAGTKYICWKLNSNDQLYLFIDDIEVGMEASAGAWQTTTVAGNTTEVNATLTGLTPETPYEAYAYPDCNPYKKSELVRFTTGECPIPHDFTADSLTSTTAYLSWTAWPDVENYTVQYRIYEHIRPIFSEGFEYSIDDWTLRDCTGNTGLTSEDAFSGNFAFFFDNNGTTQYLISPELPYIDEEMRLRFYGRHPGPNSIEIVYVGFSATNTDNASFNFVEVNVGAFGGDWHLRDYISVPAGTKYICFKRANDNSYPLFIDDIRIGINIPEGEWQTVNVTGGTSQGHVTLTGLTPETYYQAQVYNDCSAGSSFLLYFTTLETCVMPTDLTVGTIGITSANLSWTGGPETESYTVKYRTTNIAFTEGFEDGLGDWTLRNCHDFSKITNSSIGIHSGDAAFRFFYNTNPPQYLISPRLSGVAQGMKLKFYYKNEDAEYPETFQVGFSATDNATASFTFGNEITASDTEWQFYDETIPAGTKYICWKLNSNDQYILYIDDIVVDMEANPGAWQTASFEGNATEVSATLTSLTPSTLYEAYAYPDCNTLKKSEIVRFGTEAGSVFSIDIAGYGTGSGNWHLIATPFIDEISPALVTNMTTSNYDLYRFNPAATDEEWQNYKDTPYNLVNGQGYLYANSEDVTLTFSGSPITGNEPVEVPLTYDANDDHKCWNLVGNPFNCNAYLNKDYYILNTEGTGINPVAVQSTTPIPPCTAVFVKATSAGDKVVFMTFLSEHEYVDLCLPSGLLWATCNVGADAPEDYGDYFAWGETTTKDTYNWSTYQYCNGSSNTLTKYCSNASYGFEGFTDGLTTLLPEDDAATANWGNDWRMPTKEEFEELYNNTTVTWTQQNGVNGRLFTAANGNSLFLPAAGDRWEDVLHDAGNWGHYWSSSLITSYPDSAWYFYFYSGHCLMYDDYRSFGFSVRPVREN